MKVKFLRVMGIRSDRPVVLAFIGDLRVRWDRRGWTCDCDDFDREICAHVDAVAELLDPRVTGEEAC
ncbi:MAG: hypothetical protein GX595_19205 [Lentisphaerae bacterium]|nr:hypothetical protein [Lentisphaerota bacterium]